MPGKDKNYGAKLSACLKREGMSIMDSLPNAKNIQTENLCSHHQKTFSCVVQMGDVQNLGKSTTTSNNLQIPLMFHC